MFTRQPEPSGEPAGHVPDSPAAWAELDVPGAEAAGLHCLMGTGARLPQVAEVTLHLLGLLGSN